MGEPENAVGALLMKQQKNTYLVSGHNYQDARLRLYLPGNGGLLMAVGMMCAGWDGSTHPNPGFPQDGNWNVRWEGLKPLPTEQISNFPLFLLDNSILFCTFAVKFAK